MSTATLTATLTTHELSVVDQEGGFRNIAFSYPLYYVHNTTPVPYFATAHPNVECCGFFERWRNLGPREILHVTTDSDGNYNYAGISHAVAREHEFRAILSRLPQNCAKLLVRADSVMFPLLKGLLRERLGNGATSVTYEDYCVKPTREYRRGTVLAFVDVGYMPSLTLVQDRKRIMVWTSRTVLLPDVCLAVLHSVRKRRPRCHLSLYDIMYALMNSDPACCHTTISPVRCREETVCITVGDWDSAWALVNYPQIPRFHPVLNKRVVTVEMPMPYRGNAAKNIMLAIDSKRTCGNGQLCGKRDRTVECFGLEFYAPAVEWGSPERLAWLLTHATAPGVPETDLACARLFVEWNAATGKRRSKTQLGLLLKEKGVEILFRKGTLWAAVSQGCTEVGARATRSANTQFLGQLFANPQLLCAYIFHSMHGMAKSAWETVRADITLNYGERLMRMLAKHAGASRGASLRILKRYVLIGDEPTGVARGCNPPPKKRRSVTTRTTS